MKGKCRNSKIPFLKSIRNRCCRCEYSLGYTDPWPGCPPQSVITRRQNNHNSCGALVDPDNPSYYEPETYIAAYDLADYPDYEGTFAIEAIPVDIDEEETDLVTAFCGEYEERQNLTTSGVN